jgi:hypothetical protein
MSVRVIRGWRELYLLVNGNRELFKFTEIGMFAIAYYRYAGES